MQDIKATVSKNISVLRVQNGMTQLELAEKLNYSDKAVSKWERGESLPGITAICAMSELFGVTVDDILKSENIERIGKRARKKKQHNLKVIKYIIDGFIWAVTILAFVITVIIQGSIGFSWIYFIYALPVEAIVTLVLNTVWFDKRKNYIIISLLMWAILLSVYTTFKCFADIDKMLLIFLVGIAGQIIIVLWSFIKPKSQK